MSTSAAQLQFAAELVAFLVSVVGFAFALRGQGLRAPTTVRSLLGVGFLAAGAAAFLRGSLLVTRGGESALTALRLGGLALLVAGAVRWFVVRAPTTGAAPSPVPASPTAGAAPSGSGVRPPAPATAVCLVAGLGLLVVAELLGRTTGGTAPDVIRLLGAGALGGGLLLASRRSIPDRIGAGAALVLVVVLLAVSLTVSLVVAGNVEHEALTRYGTRAAREAAAAVTTAEGSLKVAHLVGGELAGGLSTNLMTLIDPTVSSSAKDSARATLTHGLITVTSSQFLDVADPVVLVDPDGVPQAAAPAGLDNTTRLALASGQVATEALAAKAERQAITVVGDHAYAAAATPLVLRRPDGPDRFAGVVVVGTRLDATYLRRIDRAGEPLSLALVTPDAVLASAGPQPSLSRLRGAARAVVDQDARPSGVRGGRFVVARPVGARDQDPQLALVVSVPTSSIEATRITLFRTLFLVALGSALVAVGLAVLLGERIGGGLRRLTAAARAISDGDLTASTGVRSEDELGVLGSAFDTMTGSLRSTTSALRQSVKDEAGLRQRLQAVIGGMSEALVAADRSGRVVECNRAAEGLLGLSVDEARGRSIDDVVVLRTVDGDRRLTLHPNVSDRPEDASSGGIGAAGEGRLVRGRNSGTDASDPGSGPASLGDGPANLDTGGEDPDTIPVAFSTATLPADETDSASGGTVMVLRDLRAERQVEDMKTEFLANIGHELRTPLTPIKGYAAALQRRPAPAEQVVRFADEIASGVDQLQRVVDQLVNFATMAAGRLQLDVVAVNPAGVVDAAVQRWTGRLEHHSLRALAERNLPDIEADRRLLDQALDELVDNARKYSPAGGVITVSALATPGGTALQVSDQGVGIDPERFRLLTAEFAQSDGSATRRFGGLGLGLALADRIVRAHGGQLRLASLTTGGACVSLVLPTPGARPEVRRAEPELAP